MLTFLICFTLFMFVYHNTKQFNDDDCFVWLKWMQFILMLFIESMLKPKSQHVHDTFNVSYVLFLSDFSFSFFYTKKQTLIAKLT